MKCGLSSEKTLEKKRNTNIKNLGVDAPAKSKKVLDKMKLTTLERYGTEYYSSTDEYKEKIKETMLKKYGTEHYNNREKAKETCLERYDVDNVSKVREIREKAENTTLERYGVKYVLQDDDIKKDILEKAKKTNLEKFGFKSPLENKEIQEKCKKTKLDKYGDEYYLNSEKYKETMLEKYGVDNAAKLDFVKDKRRNTFIKKISLKLEKYGFVSIDDDNFYTLTCDLGSEHTYKINDDLLNNRNKSQSILCTVCNPIDEHISGLELQLLEFIKDNYSGEVISNNRSIIKPYEVDIYLPEINLAIEFNGLYWHDEKQKSNWYHKVKTDMCERKNIQLIHVWEDDWNFRQDIIKSIILNKINKVFVNLDNYNIKEIEIDKAKEFFELNHIYEFKGASIYLALYNDSIIDSVVSFDDNKIINLHYKYYDKILDYYIKNYGYSELKYTISRDYFNINDFNGFKLIEIINENIVNRKNIYDNKIFNVYNSGEMKLLYK